jgi:hypothetical protein
MVLLGVLLGMEIQLRSGTGKAVPLEEGRHFASIKVQTRSLWGLCRQN